MDVTRSSDVGDAEYERFLDTFAAKPGPALAYHYPFYLRFLTGTAYPGSECRFIVARDGQGELAGVMPGIHLTTADLNVWMSLAYFGPNAGALVPKAGTREGTELVRQLVAHAQIDARERGCDSMTVYTPLDAPPEPYREALNAPDFDVERVAQCVVLPDDTSQSPWPRKVRYRFRRAASLGVVVREIADEVELDTVWDIYRQNCADNGTPPKSRDQLRRLYQTAGPHGMFLLAEHGGEIVAALICFMGGGVMSYYLPCTRPESRSLQAGALLLDHAVTAAQRAGCRLFNFEGSPRVGDSVYQFKARCGGQPVPYRVFVKLLAPDVLDKYRALGAARIAAQAPQAFVVPFIALATNDQRPTTND